MSRAQFAFIVGVLLVWFAWAAGWVVLPGHCRRADRLGHRSGSSKATWTWARSANGSGRPPTDPRADPERPKASALVLLVLFTPGYQPFQGGTSMPETPTPTEPPQKPATPAAAGRPAPPPTRRRRAVPTAPSRSMERAR